MTPPEGALALASRLDLTAAEPLRQELLARRGADLDLDGREVEQLGGLCLQILLAARRAWSEDGRAFRIAEPSPALAEALNTLGAATLLGEILEKSE